MPWHLAQLGRQFHATKFLKQVACHIFKQVDYVVLIYETHLTVNLCELWLAVGTKILVPETFGNLEVTIKTAHHQQLFQRLWTLWKRVKLSWIHARRHNKIACTLWR